MSTNSLVPLTTETWGMIERVAPAMFKSSFFGANSPEQAMAIMLKGYELGLGLGASFEFVQVIQGKPSLSPKGMLALIMRHPDYAGMKVEDQRDDKGQPSACSVWMKRRNGFEYTACFTMQDAIKAGLVKPGGGWDKYPANMLRWRAIGFCADVVFPDVIGGMKRADELGADITPGGEIIEGEVREQPKAMPPDVKAALDITSPIEQPANAPNGHWISDPSTRSKFWAWTNSMALTDSEVHEALGVSSIREYAGTKEQAREAIKVYIDAKTTGLRDEPDLSPAIASLLDSI